MVVGSGFGSIRDCFVGCEPPWWQQWRGAFVVRLIALRRLLLSGGGRDQVLACPISSIRSAGTRLGL